MKSDNRTEFLIKRMLGRSPSETPSVDFSSLNQFELNFSYPISSHRRIFGKLIVFIKKTIRYFIKPIIGPLINEQNAFNRAVANAIINLNESNKRQILELKKEISELKSNAKNFNKK